MEGKQSLIKMITIFTALLLVVFVANASLSFSIVLSSLWSGVVGLGEKKSLHKRTYCRNVETHEQTFRAQDQQHTSTQLTCDCPLDQFDEKEDSFKLVQKRERITRVIFKR